ncbi:MAG: hypothetical protein M5R36_12955 [Deltaproteobacteria bacterium]|nr:hypothetical protein [Deltaproteobacteria bacterium]
MTVGAVVPFQGQDILKPVVPARGRASGFAGLTIAHGDVATGGDPNDMPRGRVPAFPRMSVATVEQRPLTTHSTWRSRIPFQAMFYDEVDQIARGHRAIGILVDRQG